MAQSTLTTSETNGQLDAKSLVEIGNHGLPGEVGYAANRFFDHDLPIRVTGHDNTWFEKFTIGLWEARAADIPRGHYTYSQRHTGNAPIGRERDSELSWTSRSEQMSITYTDSALSATRHLNVIYTKKRTGEIYTFALESKDRGSTWHLADGRSNLQPDNNTIEGVRSGLHRMSGIIKAGEFKLSQRRVLAEAADNRKSRRKK